MLLHICPFELCFYYQYIWKPYVVDLLISVTTLNFVAPAVA